MTSDDIQAELDKDPFFPMRLHLVSGKTFDIEHAGTAFMLQASLMVLQLPHADGSESGYDLLSLWNIERIERPRGPLGPAADRKG